MRHRYQMHFQDGTGRAVASGTITVYLANSTTLATIYEAVSGGTAVTNSQVTSENSGYFDFYVDNTEYGPGQRFKIVLSKTGYTSQTYDYIDIIPNESVEYWVASSEADQGAVGGGFSVKDLVDSIGTSKTAKLVFPHHARDGNTTTYTFSTAETIPSNFTLESQPGAVFAGGALVTLDGAKCQLNTGTHVIRFAMGANATLKGVDWDTVIQAGSGETDPIIVSEDEDDGNANITIKDLKIGGNGESCSAIVLLDNNGTGGNTDHLIQNVWTDYTLDRAIVIGKGIRSKVLFNRVTRFGAVNTDVDVGAPGDDGIRITYAEDPLIDGNFVSNEDLITQQHTNGSTYGRHGITIGTNTTKSAKIVNNTIRTTERHGINLEGSSDKSICMGNLILDAGTQAISATGDHLKIIGNEIEDPGQRGISIGGQGGGYNICIGNTILNAGRDTLNANSADDAYKSAIYAADANQHYNIGDNVIYNSRGSGIYLDKGEGNCHNNIINSAGNAGVRLTSDNWSVESNTIKASSDDGISVANNIADITVVGNRCDSNVGYGIDVGTGVTGLLVANMCIDNTAGEFNGIAIPQQSIGNVYKTAAGLGGAPAYLRTQTDTAAEPLNLDQQDRNVGFFRLQSGASSSDLTANITTRSAGTIDAHFRVRVGSATRWIPYKTFG